MSHCHTKNGSCLSKMLCRGCIDTDRRVPWRLFFPMPHLVWRWRAPGCTSTGVAVGADRGLCGVLSSWRRAEGAWKGHSSFQVWGGRAYQQPHCKDTTEKSSDNVCTFWLFIYLFCLKNVLSSVYLGLLLERWLLGIQVLSLHGQTELLHRRGWCDNSK